MKYQIIEIKFDEFPSKLKRTILARTDLNLAVLGRCISYCFRARCNNFIFKSGDITYIKYGERKLKSHEKYMDSYSLKDFTKEFTLRFQLLCDSYSFKCNVHPIFIDLAKDNLVVLKEAIGKGVFSASKHTLRDLLKNKIDPNLTFDDLRDSNTSYSKPRNLEIHQLKEFFDEINLEKEQEYIDSEIKLMYENDY